MAWQLEISIIDVGQGESSLIIATDPVAGQSRSMLIDAGLKECAQTVHGYVTARLAAHGLPSLDRILVSHYDGDHSGGVIALLAADNLYGLCEVLAGAAGNAAFAAANAGQNQDHQIAAGAAAAAAAALGGYNDPNGQDRSNVAVTAGQAAYLLGFNPGDTNAQIARDGAVSGDTTAGKAAAVNASLIPAAPKRRSSAAQAGIAAGTAGGNAAARAAAALTATYNDLRTAVSMPSRFQTGGAYHSVRVIDIGNTTHTPDDYARVVGGGLTLSGNNALQVPGINRVRTGPPNLGSEVLWRPAIAAPANSPAAFVVSRLKDIWNAPANAVPIASGQPSNDDSIGLIVRFNRFFYYTGGDLPSQGEDLIANAVMANGLPDPQNAANQFATPARIACFKCGHHGSDHSTSQNFLNTVNAKAGFISSGEKWFQNESHPAQNAINRLHGDANLRYFFMTNCRYIRTHVPASQNPPEDQLLVGNKSRLAGDNAQNNLLVPRNRGDIRLIITQAESTANAPARQYRVRYWNADSNVNRFRIQPVQF